MPRQGEVDSDPCFLHGAASVGECGQDRTAAEDPGGRADHPKADHWVFIPPCTPELAEAVPDICADPPGVDRAAAHARINADALAFFRKTLMRAAEPDAAANPGRPWSPGSIRRTTVRTSEQPEVVPGAIPRTASPPAARSRTDASQ